MKILLISYWFPPAGVIGAKRWGDFFKLSKDDTEISMTILTANWKGKKENNGVYYLGDMVESKPFYSINHKIRYKDMILHPSLMIRSFDYSIKSSWYKKTKKWIENDNNNYDIIISSFSPIASVLLGNYAKKKYLKPHIVDLRDLVAIQGQKNIFPIINFLDKLLDRYIMKDVNSFFVVSPTGEKKAKKFYKRDVSIIYNGLRNPIKEKKVNLSLLGKKIITILYMGTLGINRNPCTILMLLEEYVKVNPKISFSVKFASQDDPFNFIDKEHIPSINVEWLGYLSLSKLEEEKSKSDAFLLLEDLKESGNENLTGKIFEYFYSQKPILLSCHNGSDIVKLLRITNAGCLVESLNDIEQFITEKRYLNIDACNQFTRMEQYIKMKKILGNLNV